MSFSYSHYMVVRESNQRLRLLYKSPCILCPSTASNKRHNVPPPPSYQHLQQLKLRTIKCQGTEENRENEKLQVRIPGWVGALSSLVSISISISHSMLVNN